VKQKIKKRKIEKQVTKGENINENSFGVKKVFFKKVDFWATVDLGQRVTSVNS